MTKVPGEPVLLADRQRSARGHQLLDATVQKRARLSAALH